jgi:voltage-gated potassium channel
VADALDVPVTVAGFVFMMVVLADTATAPGTTLSDVWTVAGWALWLLFVLEFVARLVMARSTAGFLRRNWWQVVFLAVPFLRFLRGFTRTSRFARLGSTTVRSTRTAAARLRSRLAWLAALTVSVVLLGTNLLFELGEVPTMADALHRAALAAVAGEPIPEAAGWARLVEIGLLLWSAVGFATLAGTAGAYFLERHAVPELAVRSAVAQSADQGQSEPEGDDEHPQPHGDHQRRRLPVHELDHQR